MENYPYSYPESHDSSPRSRDNESWDDQQPPSSYKVKFMCSYGGKIQPRPNDNQFAYVGGETKIFAVDRNIRFSTMISKLSTLYSGGDYNEVSFKYQLPGEDLDALISVTNDEDLEHMMLEYDRLYRSGGSRPARLRLFLFPLISSNQSSFSADDPKPNQQWFVDALNSVPIQSLDSSSSPAPSATDSDFLFGFDKQRQQLDQPPPPPIVVASKLPDPKLETAIPEAKIVIGDDHRNVGNDSMYEIERQIHDLQRLQISKQEQHHLQQQQQHQHQAAMFQRKNEENLNLNLPRGGGFHGDYYMPEKQPPTGVPVAVPVPATMPVPQTAYWQQQQQQHDRHMNVTGGYSDPIAGTERLQQHQQQLQQQQQQQQVYLIPSQAGMYQTPATNARQVTGQVGQQGGYYGMQRVVPDVYREQPVYTMGPPPGQPQMQPPQPQMQKMMMGETGPGGVGGGYTTTQVGYDNTGRQVYYTTASTGAPSGGVVPSSYPTAVATMPVDPRQQPGPLNQEGKVLKPTQANV